MFPIVSRKEFDEMVSQGRKLIIFNESVLDIEKWIPIHPGGKNAIQFWIGKDATDAIYAFHPPRVWESKAYNFKIADLNKDGDALSRNRKISLDFQSLVKELRSNGYFDPDLVYYVRQIGTLVMILLAAVLLIYFQGHCLLFTFLSAVLFAIVWNGLGFVLHDVGHHAILCDRKSDNHLGYFLGCALNGVSMSFWIYRHNTHHATTNSLEHDPDIQTLPALALNTRMFNNLYSYYKHAIMRFGLFEKIMCLVQAVAFYPQLMITRYIFQFNSYSWWLTSPDSRVNLRWWSEILGIAVYWSWFGYGVIYKCIPTWKLRIIFALTTQLFNMVWFWQIYLTHYGMPTDEELEEESFVRRQCRTCNNISSPEWMDWFWGGFHLQLSHHLFPRMPRSKLRQVVPIVKEFCMKHDLVYHEQSPLSANNQILGILWNVSRQVQFFKSKLEDFEQI